MPRLAYKVFGCFEWCESILHDLLYASQDCEACLSPIIGVVQPEFLRQEAGMAITESLFVLIDAVPLAATVVCLNC